MRSRTWRRHRKHEPPELNITAFMNLMVVLVPFLLITAVFSRVAILEIDLPSGEAAEPTDDQPELNLEITLRATVLEVGDRETGLLTSLPAGEDGPDLEGLAQYLLTVKTRYPDKTDATLLMEPEVDYDTLVQVMDTVRQASNRAVLFPDISLGDAVALTTAAVQED